MAAVLGSLDSHLFELRNFQANELLYRERLSNKTKPVTRGSPPERSRQDGIMGDTQVVVSPSTKMSRSTTTIHTAIVEESPLVKPTTTTSTTSGRTPRALRTTHMAIVESPTVKAATTTSTTSGGTPRALRTTHMAIVESPTVKPTTTSPTSEGTPRALRTTHMAIVESPTVKAATTISTTSGGTPRALRTTHMAIVESPTVKPTTTSTTSGGTPRALRTTHMAIVESPTVKPTTTSTTSEGTPRALRTTHMAIVESPPVKPTTTSTTSGRTPRALRTTHMAIVESPPVKPTTTTSTTSGGTPRALRTPRAMAVKLSGTDNKDRALALRVPLGDDESTVSTAEIYLNDLEAVKHLPEKKDDVLPSMDEAMLKKLVKMVVREIMESMKKPEVPIRLDDFTGEKSPCLAEDAIVWLKKLRLAARHYEWDHALALEVGAVHLKGLAGRWFASIEKHLNEELHLDRDRWNYFQAQFEERFADLRCRLLQVEKMKDLRLRHGEDIREYAEAIMSINCRLEEPLDDEFLRWVFIQGLPPSELRDKLYKFEEKPCTLAGAVKYARRFQLSQSVFHMRDSSNPTPRMSSGSMSSRSVKSN